MLTRRWSLKFIPALPALVALAAFVGGGCASPKVVPATKHDPATPGSVQIYQKPPAKDYEILGTVTLRASDKYKWDDRGNADAAYDGKKIIATQRHHDQRSDDGYGRCSATADGQRQNNRNNHRAG